MNEMFPYQQELTSHFEEVIRNVRRHMADSMAIRIARTTDVNYEAWLNNQTAMNITGRAEILRILRSALTRYHINDDDGMQMVLSDMNHYFRFLNIIDSSARAAIQFYQELANMEGIPASVRRAQETIEPVIRNMAIGRNNRPMEGITVEEAERVGNLAGIIEYIRIANGEPPHRLRNDEIPANLIVEEDPFEDVIVDETPFDEAYNATMVNPTIRNVYTQTHTVPWSNLENIQAYTYPEDIPPPAQMETPPPAQEDGYDDDSMLGVPQTLRNNFPMS